MSSSPASILEDVTSTLREHASANEQRRRLGEETVRALQLVDAFRLFVPEAYGGPKVSVADSLRTLISLSEADAAAGWCATVASQTSHMAGNLDPVWAREIFGNAASIANGAFAPSGRAVKVEGGYRLSGRWAWGSGCALAHWVSAGAMSDDNSFLQLLVQASDIEIHENWNPVGLGGTGSHDFSITDVFVPDGRYVAFGRARPTVDAAIARTPGFVLFGAGIAGVMIGIARRAVAEATELSQTKRPAQAKRFLSESPISQVELARADSLVRSATAYLFGEVEAVCELVARGERVPVENRLHVRQAAAFVSEQCIDAVDRCYGLGGGSSIHTDTALARCFRDVHTAAAHIMVSARTFETVGRHLVGLAIDTNSL